MVSQAGAWSRISTPHRENQAPCALMLSMCLSHRGVSVGTKNFPDRPKLTRALEQNIDLSMWFCIPRWYGSPSSTSGLGKHPLRKICRNRFYPGWERQFTGGKANEPLARKKRPHCPCRSRLREGGRREWCLTAASAQLSPSLRT